MPIIQKLLLPVLFFLSVSCLRVAAQCTANAGPDTTICLGASVAIGVPPASGTGLAPFTYSWTPVGGLSCADCPTPVATPSGNQVYVLTMTDDTGCVATDQVIVTVKPVPVAGFTFLPSGGCANLPVQFTNTSTGTGMTYSWNFGNPASGSANTSSLQHPVHTFATEGTGSQTFTVTLVVTNANGCTSTFSMPVTIQRTPGPSLIDPIADMKNCNGTSFPLNLFNTSVSGANSNYTIQWGDGTPDFNSGTFPGGGVPHTYTTAEIFDMLFIVTGANGCIDTARYNIANITNPAIGAANPGGTTGCGPLTLCFPLNNFASNHPTTYYVVNYGDDSPLDTLPHPPPATICHVYSGSSCGASGNAFVFKIKAVNLCDSSEASISPIRVYSGPQAAFNVSNPTACVNANVTFLNASQTGFNSSCSATTVFSWDFGDGTTATVFTLASQVHSYSAPGTYTVTLTASNACSTTTVSHTVCIEVPPVPNFTLTPSTACVPFIAQVTNLSNTTNTCNVTRNWTVLFNGSTCTPSSGSFQFVGGTNAGSANPQIQFQSPGSYTVRLTLTNSCGTFQFTQPVTAQGPPQLTLNPLTAICAGASVTPSATINNCYEPVDVFAWSFPGGTPASAATLSPGPVSYPASGVFTVSLAATNACGTVNLSTPLTVNPIPPALNPAVNSPVCLGQPANFTATTVPSVVYNWSGPGVVNPSLQNFTINPTTAASAGTYTLTGSIGGCAGPPSSVVLAIQPLPVVSVAPVNPAICQNSSIVLAASGATDYAWSPSATLSASTGTSVTASPAATTVYTVTGTTGTCSGTATVTVTVNPLPVVNAGPDTSLCDQPIPIQLSATPAGGTWSGANVTSSGSFTPNGGGAFTLTYSFTNASGCTNTDMRVVTVIAPTPANAGSDLSLCTDAANATLSGAPTGGTWSGPGVTPAGIFDPTVAGNFNLVYTFGTGTCLTRDTLVATVNPLPVVNAGADFANCIDAAPVILAGTPAGGTWTGTGITDPAGTFTPSTAGTGNHSLTYSFTDGNGCTAIDLLVATVHPLPVVNAGPDTSLCNQPVPVQLSAAPTGGTWSGTDITAGGVFTPTGTGAFTVTYTFLNANGCTGSDTRIVTVVNPAVANAGTDPVLCVNAPAVVLAPTPSGGTWTGTGVTSVGIFTPSTPGTFELIYTFGSGSCLTKDTLQALVNPLPVVNAGTDFANCIDAAAVTLNGTPISGTWSGAGITDPAGTFTPSTAGAGNHTLTYSFTDGNGCSATDQLIATVNSLPVVNAGIDTTLCDQPFPVSFTGTSTGGTWSGANVTTSGIFTPNGTGTTTLTYTFTNANGCTNADTRVVTVNAPVFANAGADFALCIDAANVVLNGTAPGGTWTGAGVTSGGIFDPTAAGTFPLVYTTGAGNCQTRDTLQATVNPLPVVSAGTDFARCIDAAPVTLSGTPSGGTWSGTGITDPAGTFTPSTAGAGNHNLTYSFTDGNGCTAIDLLIATVNPLPVVNSGNDTTLCNQPFPVQFTATPAGGTWTGPDITASGIFTPNGAGFFSVTYTFTNANGCVNSDTRIATVVNPAQANAGTDFALCTDAANVVLNGTAPGGTWTGAGVTSGGIFDPTTAGTFALVYSTGVGNCLTRDTLLAVVNPLPVVNAGNDFAQCIDIPASILAGTPAGGTWTGTGITNAAGNFSPAAAGPGTHTLTYAFTDVNGCSSSDQLVATINPLPMVNAGIDTTICDQPFPIQFTATPTGGTWSGTNVTASGVFTPNGPGTIPLTYTFTNANGCTNADTRIVTVNAPVFANAGADFALCIDAANAVLNGTAPGGTWTGAGVTSGGIFDPTAAGTFPLVYTTGAGNCLTRDTLTALVNPLPVVSIGPDLDFCSNNAPVDLAENPAGGTWTGTGIQNSATGLFDPSVPAPGSYMEIYRYTHPLTGCINSDTLLAVIHPTPVPGFSFNPVICAGIAELFTNTSTFGNTYDWEFGDGGTSSAQQPGYSYPSPGFFNVELVVTSAFGCTDSLTQPIEVRIPPTADFSLSPDSSCAPVIVSFANNSSGPSLSFNWNFGNGQSSTAINPGTQTYNQGINDSSYLVTLSVTNFCGTDIHTETITAMPSPTASFGTNTDIVCSLVIDLMNTSTGLPDSYAWDFGDGSTSTTSAAGFQHTFATGLNDTTYTIMLAVANECGADTAYHTVTILPNVVTAFFNTDVPSGCVPHTVNFTQFSTGGTMSNWDFGDGNVSTASNPAHTFTTPGTFTVHLYVNDGCGYDTTTATITVFPSPNVAFSSDPDSVCINELFTFTNLSAGLANVTWAFGDGDSSVLFNPTHVYAATGTYQVTLTGISQTNGCAASVTHPVVVSTNPVADFTANPVSGCVPLNVSFTNTSTNTSFQAWNFGDGNSSTQFSPSHTFTSAGSYTVKLYVENANGCADSIAQIITVYPLPVAGFSFVNTNSCYQPVSVTTTNTSTGALNYAWDFGDGTTSALTNPGHNYVTPGTYTIQLTASNIYGCTDIATQTINIYQVPTAGFLLPEDTVCVGEPIVFQSTSTFADSIVWNFGNGTTFTGTSIDYAFTGSGTFPVTIMAYGAGGCGDTLTVNTPIVVHPTPVAGFESLNIQNPDPLSGTVEFTNTSIGGTNWQWDFGNGDTSTVMHPIERYNTFGEFITTLIALNEFGCADTISNTVTVDFFYGLFIPNAISPGHFEFEVANFIPKGVGLATFELLIYDDWGNLIWETRALDADGRPTEYWDGTFRGVPVQQDSYVWKASATFLNYRVWEGKEYGNKKLKRSGTVTVIR